MARESYLTLPPYEVHGRWYKIFFESDNHSLTVQGDLDAVGDGQFIKLPTNFHVLDVISDYHFTNASELPVYQEHLVANTTDTGFYLKIRTPTINTFDYCTMYVFGYME